MADLIRRDLFFAPEEVANVDWRSRLSYQELTFLVGFLFQQGSKRMWLNFDAYTSSATLRCRRSDALITNRQVNVARMGHCKAWPRH